MKRTPSVIVQNDSSSGISQESEFLTAEQLANRLGGISPRTIIRSWIPRGFPYIDIGIADMKKRRVRFRWSEVLDWLEREHREKHPTLGAR